MPPSEEPKFISKKDPEASFPAKKSQKFSLATVILKHVQNSVFDEQVREFVPNTCIESLLTPDAVRQGLYLSDDPEFDEEVIDFVMKSARKLFITSLLAGLGARDHELANAMKQFEENGVDDKSLPLPDSAFRIDEDGEPLDPWTGVSRRNFRKDQWMVLVPTISESNPELDLDPHCILPIIEKSKAGESGAFGVVFQVKIHKEHHLDPIMKLDGERADVAIKVIKPVCRDTTDQDDLKQLRDEWTREVEAHIAMRNLKHRNIIEFIAAIKRGSDRYLLFRWAEEGSLRKYWEVPEHKRPLVTKELVRDVILQIRGMADALDKLHNYRFGGGSYRHGDLKPENILCVVDQPPRDGQFSFPILKISDMGLAKHHNIATQLRHNTSTQYTTTRYEPPEVALKSKLGRSRRYDMWSFGCVVLEMMIWLLHGSDTLERFNSQIIDEGRHRSHWFKVDKDKDQAFVHPHVQATIRALYYDPECKKNTALRELLTIVETKLLVVELDPPATPVSSSAPPKSTNGSRAYSRELMDRLNHIVAEGNTNESYWFTGTSREHIRDLKVNKAPETSFLSPNSAAGRNRPPRPRGSLKPSGEKGDRIVPEIRFDDQQSLLDRTEYPVDNKFAQQLVAGLTPSVSEIYPVNLGQARLCKTCASHDLCKPQFYITDNLAELEVKRTLCDFCKLRYEACHHINRGQVQTVRFDREQSMLKLNENPIPALSICRSADFIVPNSNHIQIGFPNLPAPASTTHFAILTEWLNDCDKNHRGCEPLKNYPPPTRLIDLGSPDAPVIRLIQTTSTETIKYIALSHPWGQGHSFCTFPRNLATHRSAIPVHSPDFPDTFRDAIAVTRALGVQYLWIDSICIIQGPDGDFETEAKRMEDVFSAAYCVIAASSARGQRDGFLKTRKERQFLQLRGGSNGSIQNETQKGGLYVCRFIDNFSEHVLNGPLSKRGWVLQERALARRTIYFTDWQTYWECGCGVRCETLTKIDNKLTSFLGDPSFPSKLSSSLSDKGFDRGERIRFYEDLYRQYSRLNFTRLTDRPIAIAGLEQRMINNLNAKGGYGIFHDGGSLLPRSLLWRRGAEEAKLNRVDFSQAKQKEGKNLPSWSWMAYGGAIDFLDLPLGGVDWKNDAVLDPFSSAGSSGDDPSNETAVLKAMARPFSFEPIGERWESFDVILDAGNAQGVTGWEEWKAVVVGTRRIAKGEIVPVEHRTHYLLIITALPGDNGQDTIYQRIGVGYMPGRLLGEEEVQRVTVG
ncbi:HET-domain-containing protein [Triangularia verruculosa]|uniref:HET-domain-containing protein n=1 Tax=Triangularia verruculosa TaxID=2587418 RepID=A0AAN6XD38_9PEZI|nr:HET-domain-containing protein [Triangularia verruculosa]